MDPVDLALCLAIDVSASVDYDEFGLMIGGTAAAFRDPGIAAACAGGPRGAVAVAVLFWSGAWPSMRPPSGGPEVAVPWMRIDGAAAAAALAEAIDNAPGCRCRARPRLGEGMAAGLGQLARCPAPASRLVLDVSGDGKHNQGRLPGPVRDIGVAAGVTLNGLAVLNEEPDLLDHYRAEVIGGPGCFAMDCPDYAAFAQAIREKLAREIGGLLLSRADRLSPEAY
ncbi:DUF1194 domain-containing protein [Dankookia sp. P2]|uniref:DUF1194 domain-containing protein n=1 Tax=Dankookia sp. P2 TaxID=3423955 RepID=UPI003D66BC3C